MDAPDPVLEVFANGEEALRAFLESLEAARARVEHLVEENGRLRQRVTELETDARANLFSEESPEEFERLHAENARLRRELAAIDSEYQHFARRCIEVEAQNEALANLYVASSQLHSSLQPEAVIQAISDIVVGLVGAASWAVFEREEETGDFVVVAGEGIDERFPERRVRPGEGPEGRTAESGRPFIGDAGSADAQTALLPLMDRGECVALVAVYGLLSHKPGPFTPIDHELLNLLAGQAAAALTSSKLYVSSARPMTAM